MSNSDNTRPTDEHPRKRRGEESQRKARINRSVTGDAIGIGLFVTAAELRALDVNPDTYDRVAYCVRDGAIRLAVPDYVVSEE